MDLATRLDIRREVAALEAAMMTSPDRIAIEPLHFFAEGLYGREVHMPAGTLATGHTHGQEHLCIISKGLVSVITETGARDIQAPATFVVPVGTKNCVYVREDAVWTTIHATTLRDVGAIEAAVLIPTHPDETKALA